MEIPKAPPIHPLPPLGHPLTPTLHHTLLDPGVPAPFWRPHDFPEGKRLGLLVIVQKTDDVAQGSFQRREGAEPPVCRTQSSPALICFLPLLPCPHKG